MQICAKLLLTLRKTIGSMEMPWLAYNRIYRMQEFRIPLGRR